MSGFNIKEVGIVDFPELVGATEAIKRFFVGVNDDPGEVLREIIEKACQKDQDFPIDIQGMLEVLLKIADRDMLNSLQFAAAQIHDEPMCVEGQAIVKMILEFDE